MGEPVTEERPGISLLKSWLNKSMKVLMSDGRVLVGIFLCTDKAGNVIIGSCNEYTESSSEPRMLGLAMVPGKHIDKIWIDLSSLRPNSPGQATPAEDEL